MASAAENQFEIERRSILFKSTTSLPDESLLGFDANPNGAIEGNSAGEFLLYNSPIGTSYQESKLKAAAKAKAKGSCLTLYDVFKKAHRMITW